MSSKLLKNVLRDEVLFCRFYLRFLPHSYHNEELGISKLLTDLSRFGGVLYERSNQRFVKPSVIPLKIDLAMHSRDLVTLASFLTSIRGYTFDDTISADYTKVPIGIDVARNPDLNRVVEKLYKKRRRIGHSRNHRKSQVMFLQDEPFVFSTGKPNVISNLSGADVPLRRENIFNPVWADPFDKDGTTERFTHVKDFVSFPVKNAAIEIVPCFLTNLTELPKAMRDWARISQPSLRKDDDESLRTLFDGFSGF